MEDAPPVPSNERPPDSWFSMWVKAVIQPSFATYQAISAHPNATAGQAYLWVAGATVAGYIIYAILAIPLQSLSGMVMGASAASSVTTAISGSFGTILCGIPIGTVMSIGLFALGTFVTYKTAQASGGTSSHGALAYTFASYASPIIFVILAANALGPFGLCLSLPVSLYGMTLSIVAVRAVMGIGTGSAIAATVVRALAEGAVIGLIACGIITLLTLLGPALLAGMR